MGGPDAPPRPPPADGAVRRSSADRGRRVRGHFRPAPRPESGSRPRGPDSPCRASCRRWPTVTCRPVHAGTRSRNRPQPFGARPTLSPGFECPECGRRPDGLMFEEDGNALPVRPACGGRRTRCPPGMPDPVKKPPSPAGRSRSVCPVWPASGAARPGPPPVPARPAPAARPAPRPPTPGGSPARFALHAVRRGEDAVPPPAAAMFPPIVTPRSAVSAPADRGPEPHPGHILSAPNATPRVEGSGALRTGEPVHPGAAHAVNLPPAPAFRRRLAASCVRELCHAASPAPRRPTRRTASRPCPCPKTPPHGWPRHRPCPAAGISPAGARPASGPDCPPGAPTAAAPAAMLQAGHAGHGRHAQDRGRENRMLPDAGRAARSGHDGDPVLQMPAQKDRRRTADMGLGDVSPMTGSRRRTPPLPRPPGGVPCVLSRSRMPATRHMKSARRS